jgi:phosphonate dehydrogenase
MSDLPIVVLTNETFPETRRVFDGVAHLIANEQCEPWDEETLRAKCRDASGVMAFMTDRIDADFLDACPRLKVIGAALKGFDNIDVAAASARGVWVTICEDLLTIPTAELAIGLMLTLGRQLLKGDRETRENGFRGWRPVLYGTGLHGSNVGIIGFGKVGQAIAERLSGFGCRITAFDSSSTTFPARFNDIVSRSDLQPLLTHSDFVVLALPLKADTMHIIDAAAIAEMKPGALLINPARGSLVDERAVASSIAAGHLAGYAADVFECEDWARHDRPRAIDLRLREVSAPTVLTPHIGSAVTKFRRQIELSAASSIVDVLSGKRPVTAVNAPDR